MALQSWSNTVAQKARIDSSFNRVMEGTAPYSQ